MTNISFISALGYFVGVAGAIAILFSRVKTDNLHDLKERVEILEKELVYSKQLLEKERADAQKQHIKNRESIAELRKEVSLYKDLQLDSIADTNRRILKVLDGSALIASNDAHDGGLLVQTKQKE